MKKEQKAEMDQLKKELKKAKTDGGNANEQCIDQAKIIDDLQNQLQSRVQAHELKMKEAELEKIRLQTDKSNTEAEQKRHNQHHQMQMKLAVDNNKRTNKAGAVEDALNAKQRRIGILREAGAGRGGRPFAGPCHVSELLVPLV